MTALYDSGHVAERRTCVRCGRPRRTHSGRTGDLCRDCKSVVHLMGETHLWDEQETA